MSTQNDHRTHKTLRFMAMVDDECRRSGGKHLLTREEYLQIVTMCYRHIFGDDPQQADPSEFDQGQAPTG